MSFLSLPIEERLDCLQELLSCSGTVHRWCYDADGELLETNCPDLVLGRIFSHTGGMRQTLEHAIQRKPLVLSLSLGLLWSAAYEYDGDALARIHILGPVGTTELTYATISGALQNSEIPAHWRSRIIHTLERVPIASTIDFFRQTLMLHFAVTGERLTNADITFRSADGDIAPSGQKPPKKDRMKVWLLEQALMRMVSEGDLNYKSILNEASTASGGVGVTGAGSLQQIKVSQIVFISLCTRAAIQGGISPELAYSRGDAYIQDVLDCKSIADAAHIGHTMYEDFIRMVHKGRTNPNLSKQIQSCCDYIELHADEKLSLADIARRIGYAEYYLSRKFREETGLSINSYIKFVKVERAKTLLLSTNMDIQEICDALSFGSRSFFSQTFRSVVGVPPAAYREQNQHI